FRAVDSFGGPYHAAITDALRLWNARQAWITGYEFSARQRDDLHEMRAELSIGLLADLPSEPSDHGDIVKPADHVLYRVGDARRIEVIEVVSDGPQSVERL